MFQSLQPLPADAILGLIAEHREDPRSQKIDLGVGVYRNAAGETPVLDAVKQAEQRVLDAQVTKAYLGTAGDPGFNTAMQALTFGASDTAERVRTLQAPGGSGSLRVAASLILRARPDAALWVGDPTWANHVPLLGGAGLTLKTHPYYDTERHVIRLDAMLDALRSVPKGDMVLLHACCHNPSGLDPTEEQWREIAQVLVERDLVPFIDMAYQGFAKDLDEDAFVIRHLAAQVPEMIVCSSCSKNFGLYRDRVGTLSIMAENATVADTVFSQVNNVVRTIYSMPPDHGAAVVRTILEDDTLRATWTAELAEMRERLTKMRRLLHDALRDKAPDHDFSHLARATGMFCFLGVTSAEVERLKREFGIYMVDSSRINVAGITPENVEYLADSIAAVL